MRGRTCCLKHVKLKFLHLLFVMLLSIITVEKNAVKASEYDSNLVALVVSTLFLSSEKKFLPEIFEADSNDQSINVYYGSDVSTNFLPQSLYAPGKVLSEQTARKQKIEDSIDQREQMMKIIISCEKASRDAHYFYLQFLDGITPEERREIESRLGLGQDEDENCDDSKLAPDFSILSVNGNDSIPVDTSLCTAETAAACQTILSSFISCVLPAGAEGGGAATDQSTAEGALESGSDGFPCHELTFTKRSNRLAELNSAECPVCLNPYKPEGSSEALSVMKCWHVLHKKCIDGIVKQAAAAEQAAWQAAWRAADQAIAAWQAAEHAVAAEQAAEQAAWLAGEQAAGQAAGQALWQAAEQTAWQATEQAAEQAAEQTPKCPLCRIPFKPSDVEVYGDWGSFESCLLVQCKRPSCLAHGSIGTVNSRSMECPYPMSQLSHKNPKGFLEGNKFILGEFLEASLKQMDGVVVRSIKFVMGANTSIEIHVMFGSTTMGLIYTANDIDNKKDEQECFDTLLKDHVADLMVIYMKKNFPATWDKQTEIYIDWWNIYEDYLRVVIDQSILHLPLETKIKLSSVFDLTARTLNWDGLRKELENHGLPYVKLFSSKKRNKYSDRSCSFSLGGGGGAIDASEELSGEVPFGEVDIIEM